MDTVGQNRKMIAEYIRTQLEEDYAGDQASIKEYMTRLRVSRENRQKKTAARERLPVKVMRCQTFCAPFRGYACICPF